MLQAGSHNAAGAGSDTSCLHAPPSSSSVASTFPAYTQLPHAVADRIIILACRSPDASCSAEDAAQRSPLALDVTTTLSLARVSKRISKVTTPLLYEFVRVIKPSALLELYDTVSTQSGKAKLIKNLHIGAEETFPTSEWPLSIEEGTEESERPLLHIKTTFGLKEEHRLPKWCTPERTWPCELDRVSEIDVREVAVVQAIISALDYIDLDLYAREYGRSGTHIGPEMWAVRIFELQACLDLYLSEMRRIEDASRGKYATASASSSLASSSSATSRSPSSNIDYPRLVVTYISAAPSRAAAKVKAGGRGRLLTLTRAQLWKHLTRRGAALDQFDHPIIFSRAGLRANPMTFYGIARMMHYLNGPHAKHFGRCYVPPAVENEPDDESMAPNELRIINSLGLASVHTVHGLTVAAQRVVNFSSSLVNLSLTGYLELSLAMPNPSSTWGKLRHLSLGPLLSATRFSIFNSHHLKLSSLESLRVSGCLLIAKEAKEIAGATDRFPKLKRFLWELVSSHSPSERVQIHEGGRGDTVARMDDDGRLTAILKCLQGKPFNPGSEVAASRLMEVRMHRQTWLSLARSLSPETVQDWTQGTLRVDEATGSLAPHRLQVRQSTAADTETNPEAEVKMLHENAREWWEECAKLEKERRDPGADWMPNASGGYPFAAAAQESKADAGLAGVEEGDRAEAGDEANVIDRDRGEEEAERVKVQEE